MSKLVTQNFRGSVCLKDWFQDPISGRSVRSVTGRITILKADEVIGFDPGKSEANWVARVEGPTQSYNFPGCQVRCIIDHRDVTTPNSAADALAVA